MTEHQKSTGANEMSAATQNGMDKLRRERDALAVHTELLAKELKRCMSLLHCNFPSSDKDAAYNEAKKCLEAAPAASLASDYRRQAERGDQ